MQDIKHSMCKLQIVWNVDDCGVPLHAHFRRGVALVGKFDYWALLTLSWDPPLWYREYSEAEHADQPDMQGTFYTCICFLMNPVY